jgi:hypothetical protein
MFQEFETGIKMLQKLFYEILDVANLFFHVANN